MQMMLQKPETKMKAESIKVKMCIYKYNRITDQKCDYSCSST